MEKPQGSIAQLLDLGLVVICGALFVVLMIAAAVTMVADGWREGVGAVAFAVLNAGFSLTAFRRLRSAMKVDRDVESKTTKTRNWMGDV